MVRSLLIACHPKDYYSEGHWQSSFIDTIVEEYKIDVIYTVDIIPGGSYTFDIFDYDTLVKYYESYDFVYLPDCGGLWCNYQNAYFIEGIFELINNLLLIVKPGGHLALSKFIMDGLEDAILRNYNSIRVMFEEYNIPVIIITK